MAPSLAGGEELIEDPDSVRAGPITPVAASGGCARQKPLAWSCARLAAVTGAIARFRRNGRLF